MDMSPTEFLDGAWFALMIFLGAALAFAHDFAVRCRAAFRLQDETRSLKAKLLRERSTVDALGAQILKLSDRLDHEKSERKRHEGRAREWRQKALDATPSAAVLTELRARVARRDATIDQLKRALANRLPLADEAREDHIRDLTWGASVDVISQLGADLIHYLDLVECSLDDDQKQVIECDLEEQTIEGVAHIIETLAKQLTK